MHAFITGGTGFIGSAVIAELIERGHAVTALGRAPEKRDWLAGLGACPVRGDISEPETYRGPAAGHDLLIHCAFSYGPDTVEADRTAIDVLVAAARDTVERAAAEGDEGPVSLIYTSGCWNLGDTGGSSPTRRRPPGPPRW